MTNAALNTGTWRRKSALATWQHRVPMTDGVHPTRTLCDAAARAWSIIDGFADVATASWTTISSGEDALVEERPVFDAERVRSACVGLGDATRLDLRLDLRCVGLDGSEGVIARGATLVLDLDWPDPTSPGKGVPDLDVVLHLDVDIHAPRTGGHHPDNRALAALNGPRLTAFLRRLRSELGAELVDVDAYAGHDTINEDGFAPPDGS